jgi:GTP-binding protein HflX
MLESTESLLPSSPHPDQPLRVITLGREDESLDELDRLLDTLGVQRVGRVYFHSQRINPATYVGAGKLEETKRELEIHGAEAVIVDFELSPNQLRNIEKSLGKSTLDRPGVIIEIFSRHARTKESKTQVELARLQYLLPRLAHFWTHFERQRGGIGLKGMGEKQIEVDRRLVKKRMMILEQRLKDIEKERIVQRASRKDLFKVALVGYTNAGKSTLLNALTQSRVLAEDKLFATLDASVRTLDPDSHPPIVAIDTVGFISNLPHGLVASFRSTLEELHQADLLLHVVDASSAQAFEQHQVTEQVLKDLHLEAKPRMVVLNKMDLLPDPAARNRARAAAPGALTCSALDLAEVARVRDRILEHFRQGMEVYDLLIPYSESKADSMVHAHGVIENSRHLEKGNFYRVRLDPGMAKKLDLLRFKT